MLMCETKMHESRADNLGVSPMDFEDPRVPPLHGEGVPPLHLVGGRAPIVPPLQLDGVGIGPRRVVKIRHSGVTEVNR